MFFGQYMPFFLDVQFRVCWKHTFPDLGLEYVISFTLSGQMKGLDTYTEK